MPSAEDTTSRLWQRGNHARCRPRYWFNLNDVDAITRSTITWSFLESIEVVSSLYSDREQVTMLEKARCSTTIQIPLKQHLCQLTTILTERRYCTLSVVITCYRFTAISESEQSTLQCPKVLLYSLHQLPLCHGYSFILTITLRALASQVPEDPVYPTHVWTLIVPALQSIQSYYSLRPWDP